MENVANLSITTDIWISYKHRSYLTVTGYFIFNDRLYLLVLATKKIHEFLTDAKKTNLFSDILIEWTIKDKILT